MLLIRLYPYIYCDILNNRILLFDTFSKEIRLIHTMKSIINANTNSFFLDEPNSEKFYIQNKIGNYGIVNIVEDNNVKVLSDYSSLLSERLKEMMKITDNKYVVEKCVSRIFLNLSAIEVVNMGFYTASCSISEGGRTLLSLKNNITRFRNRYSVHINVDEGSLLRLKELLKVLDKKENVYIYIPYDSFIKSKPSIIGSFKNKTIIVNSISDICLSELNELSYDEGINIVICINNADDYLFIKNSVIGNNRRIRYTYNLSAEIETLKKILEFEIRDVKSLNQTKYDLIRKEYINSLYWGDIYIDNLGYIQLGENKSIGNINDWESIAFSKLIMDENSIWGKKRKDFFPCHECIYRNLCPPLSICEMTKKIAFCNKKMKICN